MSAPGNLPIGRVLEELMRINNEQANALRDAAKALAAAVPQAAPGDEAVLDEFSRVNNELATLQRELARKNAELVRLNEQKNRLLGMAAHDLRTPLAVIRSYSEFLRDEAADALDAEQREFVNAILDASRFMLAIVNDLLDVAGFEAGVLRLELEETDLVGLLHDNLALNRVLATRKGVALELDAPRDALPIAVDARKIHQVLNNLLGNAVKFSPPGGTVRVRLAAGGDAARVTVSDQGAGIAADDLPHIFQPFGRARRPGTSGEPSTGLGLAIVRRIIEGHGGQVSVSSESGQGASFAVTLPRRTER